MEVKLWKTNIRMGGGQNTRKINPLFKDVKEYNKYLLSLIGIFVLLLSGIISYNYTNTSYAKWSSSVESKNILKLSVKTEKDALSFAKDNVGTGGLEEITHEIDDTLQVDSKFTTEYRYRGGDSTVNNYVTFNNETWRIIGITPTEDTNGNVENRFKIIRDESIGKMKWNETKDTTTNSYNNWVTGTLNTYLNNDYYNTLTSDAKNMIGTAKYYLGGHSDAKITSDIMWQYERKNETNRTGYYHGTNPINQNDASKKIAIMYASDYGYAASKECNLFDYNSASCRTTDNWLDKSAYTWLLPQSIGGIIRGGGAFYVYQDGHVMSNTTVYTNELTVRPVLYLSSNVKISGGEGTSQKPYMLSIS